MSVTGDGTVPIREALTMWSGMERGGGRDRRFFVVGRGEPEPLKSCKTGGWAFMWWRDPQRTNLELSHALLFEALDACVDGCDPKQVFAELEKVRGFCVPGYHIGLGP